MMKGIDVAKWNGNIDWNKVKAAGVEFAVLKVINKSNKTISIHAPARGATSIFAKKFSSLLAKIV